jgi:microcystin-dependent protein
MFAGSTAPTGWLLCDGTAVSRTTYSDLFAITSTTYGVGDGSTTFNLPNLKGRVPVGLDTSQTEFDVLGETGGAKTHTLTSTEIPGHTHTTDIAHGHASTLAAPAHTHPVDPPNTTVTVNGKDVITGDTGTSDFTFVSGSTRSFVDATASVNIASFTSGAASATALTGSVTDLGATSVTSSTGSGGGAAHNNLQPYIALNYMIKT